MRAARSTNLKRDINLLAVRARSVLCDRLEGVPIVGMKRFNDGRTIGLPDDTRRRARMNRRVHGPGWNRVVPLGFAPHFLDDVLAGNPIFGEDLSAGRVELT